MPYVLDDPGSETDDPHDHLDKQTNEPKEIQKNFSRLPQAQLHQLGRFIDFEALRNRFQGLGMQFEGMNSLIRNSTERYPRTLF